MKRQCFLVLILFFGLAAYSQTQDVMKRVYEYDEAGNRVVRKVLELQSPSPSPPKHKSMDDENDGDENGDVKEVEEAFLLDKVGDVKLKLFPNPTTSMVTIQIENMELVGEGFIHVYNTTATLLGTQQIVSSSASIDLSAYPAGIYLVNIIINGKETRWKIVKK